MIFHNLQFFDIFLNLVRFVISHSNSTGVLTLGHIIIAIHVVFLSRFSTVPGLFTFLIRWLLVHQLPLSVVKNTLAVLFGFSFNGGHLRSVPSLNALNVFVNIIFWHISFLIEFVSISYFNKLPSVIHSVDHIYPFVFDIMHIVNKLISSIQIVDSFMSSFLFFLQFDNSRSNLNFIIFDLLLVNDGLHHLCLSLGSHDWETWRHELISLIGCWPLRTIEHVWCHWLVENVVSGVWTWRCYVW